MRTHWIILSITALIAGVMYIFFMMTPKKMMDEIELVHTPSANIKVYIGPFSESLSYDGYRWKDGAGASFISFEPGTEGNIVARLWEKSVIIFQYNNNQFYDIIVDKMIVNEGVHIIATFSEPADSTSVTVPVEVVIKNEKGPYLNLKGHTIEYFPSFELQYLATGDQHDYIRNLWVKHQ